MEIDAARSERGLARLMVGGTFEKLAALRAALGHYDDALIAAEHSRGYHVLNHGNSSTSAGVAYDLSAREALLSEARESLRHDTAVVGWIDATPAGPQPECWAYVLRSDTPVVWRRVGALGATDMTELLARFRELGETVVAEGISVLGAGSYTSVLDHARELWSARFAPIEDLLDGVEQLVLIPSMPMATTPIGLFIDDKGRALDERFAISYASSVAIQALLWERDTDGAPARALVVADPVFQQEHLPAVGLSSGAAVRTGRPDSATVRSVLEGNHDAISNLPRLHWSRQEAEGVARMFAESTVLVGPEASESALWSHLLADSSSGYDVIHFATHALIDASLPERSSLILSRVDEEPHVTALGDGLVTWQEMLEHWTATTRLVTLSACETALGRSSSAAVVGFADLLLATGASSVLASLWKVDDEATSRLMQRFYANWTGADGAPPARKSRALADAKLWLRSYEDERGERPYEHPTYWSGFVLTGSAR